MTFSTSYSRIKARKSKWGVPGLFLALFLLSLGFAFGIGYQFGEDAGRTLSPPPSNPPAMSAGTPARSGPAVPSSMLWAPAGRIQYTLYLASFQSMAEAERERTRMEAKGLKGIEISERMLPGTGSRPWYRLRYGRFPTRTDALEQGRQLTERGVIRDFWPKELL